jgi:hypothetical protein
VPFEIELKGTITVGGDEWGLRANDLVLRIPLMNRLVETRPPDATLVWYLRLPGQPDREIKRGSGSLPKSEQPAAYAANSFILRCIYHVCGCRSDGALEAHDGAACGAPILLLSNFLAADAAPKPPEMVPESGFRVGAKGALLVENLRVHVRDDSVAAGYRTLDVMTDGFPVACVSWVTDAGMPLSTGTLSLSAGLRRRGIRLRVCIFCCGCRVFGAHAAGPRCRGAPLRCLSETRCPL